MQVSIGGDLEIEQRLDAYARVRLSPTERASARMRARVMRQARIAMATASAASVTSSSDLARARRRGGLLRRSTGVLLAAALSLAVAGGAMAAAQAGGPLYPTRMWLETITLPAEGAARADADLVRLESRMQEVVAAAWKGDRGGVSAALQAYQQIADEALLAATGDAAAIERVRLALDRHLAVLVAVAAKVPPQASEAIGRNIDRAIERNGATLERIQSNQGGGGPATQPGPAAKPEKTPKPAANPAAEPTPVRTQRPQPTPAPAEPPKGQPDPKPDKTPPSHGRSQQP